jgi:hypothetical protein
MPHYDTYDEWVRGNQQTECAVCYGRGWVLQEDASGRPTVEVTCPYCHGRRSQAWLPERRAGRFQVWHKRRNILIIATIALWACGNAFNTSNPYSSSGGDLMLLHIALWLAVIAGWVVYFIQRRPKQEKPGYTPKHAPGFTTDREKTALGLFAAGVSLRSLFGRKQ